MHQLPSCRRSPCLTQMRGAPRLQLHSIDAHWQWCIQRRNCRRSCTKAVATRTSRPARSKRASSMARHASSLCILVTVFALAASSSAQIKQIPLAYKLDALEPAIDTQTMKFHYGTHYATYINNTNAALTNATGLAINKSNLTALIQAVTNTTAPLNTTLRNQGGGAWNHALYFRHLAPVNTSSPAQISPPLSNAIRASFGTFENMTALLTSAASKVFGSGWAWVCYTGGQPPLIITTTPNQDNPLMGNLPGAPRVVGAGCTPILGLDVWEHAYYLKHGPKRAAYLADFFTAVNWRVVSNNFDLAKQGKAEAMVKP